MRRLLDARCAGCVVLLSLLTLTGARCDAAGDKVDPRWDTVIVRLDAVHEALASYQDPNGRAYPGHLYALYPDFIGDRSLLLDPFTRTPKDRGSGNSAPVTLGYRMPADIFDSDSGGMEARGGHFPILHAGRQRGMGVLNMSLSGHLYFSPVDWRPLAVALGAATQKSMRKPWQRL